MTISATDLINSIMDSFDRIDHIKTADIPNIELYMDQVTTLIDSRLKPSTRNPGEDKLLTKTMINNYTKNDLLPPPIKKKYSKEHVLVLIFIYYFKGVMSINDIKAVLGPITDKFFQGDEGISLEEIYNEVFSLESGQIRQIKEDVMKKYMTAAETFADVDEQNKDFLQMFSFICLLSFDVYVKKLLIEKLVDVCIDMEKDDSKGKK